MRRCLLAMLVLVATTGFTWLERWAAPDARLIDEHWHERDIGATATVDHAAWARWLDRYVVTDAAGANRVRYAGVTAADRDALEGYIADLAATRVTALRPDEQLAYWLNLYNAVTVHAILEAYPVESIRDIDGVWTEPRVSVEGRPLSLDDIEHGIVRPIFDDARIHYAVNCAAIACPDLGAAPYVGATLDAALEAAARDYVNDPRGVRITTGGDVVVSSIYNWFSEDFGDNERDVLAHVRRYAAPALRARLEGIDAIDDFAYDWSLNDAR